MKKDMRLMLQQQLPRSKPEYSVTALGKLCRPLSDPLGLMWPTPVQEFLAANVSAWTCNSE